MKSKSKNVVVLNKIQEIITLELKAQGYQKSGRTFNKEISKGLIHVINFQMGLRSMEGQFTVNLGVFIEELDQMKAKNTKSIKKEYECSIRTRLNELIINEEEWFDLKNNPIQTAKIISNSLAKEGMQWFKSFNSREVIIKNLQKLSVGKFNNRSRSKLDAALIQLNINTEKGVKIFKSYFHSINDNKPHKDYVAKLASSKNIELEYSQSNEESEFLKSLGI